MITRYRGNNNKNGNKIGNAHDIDNKRNVNGDDTHTHIYIYSSFIYNFLPFLSFPSYIPSYFYLLFLYFISLPPSASLSSTFSPCLSTLLLSPLFPPLHLFLFSAHLYLRLPTFSPSHPYISHLPLISPSSLSSTLPPSPLPYFLLHPPLTPQPLLFRLDTVKHHGPTRNRVKIKQSSQAPRNDNGHKTSFTAD